MSVHSSFGAHGVEIAEEKDRLQALDRLTLSFVDRFHLAVDRTADFVEPDNGFCLIEFPFSDSYGLFLADYFVFILLDCEFRAAKFFLRSSFSDQKILLGFESFDGFQIGLVRGRQIRLRGIHLTVLNRHLVQCEAVVYSGENFVELYNIAFL